MALKIYKISEFNHKAKIGLFDELCKLLAERCEDGKEECIVVGNYNVEGVEIDAMVVTQYGVMVFDFKNGGGNIVAREVGEWTQNDHSVAGGAYGKSPMVNARMMRNRLRSSSSKLLGCQLSDAKVVVVFSMASSIDDSALSESTKSWLTVCDINNIADVWSKSDK